MKIFLDSADINEIQSLSETGLIDGVTTNPSLIAKSGMNFLDGIKNICSIIKGPVSAEVTATDHKTMMIEAEKLSKIAKNVTIKVPLTMAGVKTCHVLSKQGISVNVTLCFSPAQAILAAKAGATFISPFIGRLDDLGLNDMLGGGYYASPGGNKLIDYNPNPENNYPPGNAQIATATAKPGFCETMNGDNKVLYHFNDNVNTVTTRVNTTSFPNNITEAP